MERCPRLGRLKRVAEPGMDLHYIHDALGRRIGKVRDGNLVALFVYGTRAHVPDAMIKNGTRYLFVTDQVGSVRLVVNSETGAVVQRIDYDAWGNVLSDNNPGFQPFGFAGGLYDGATKLVRFGARDYDPEVGRWTAKDPVLFIGRQANLYEYVGSNPINAVDPFGLWAGVFRELGINWRGPDWHRNRNVFQECPPTRPCTSRPDEFGGGWEDQGPANPFHRSENSDFRGTDRNSGVQCIYEPSGDLVTDPEWEGTWDYEPPGSFIDDARHTLWDVVPYLIWGN